MTWLPIVQTIFLVFMVFEIQQGVGFRMPSSFHKSFLKGKNPVMSRKTSTKVFSLEDKSWVPKSELDMDIDSLKAELELRRVDYSECINRKDLQMKLKEARMAGVGSNYVLENVGRKIFEPEVVPDPTSRYNAKDPYDLLNNNHQQTNFNTNPFGNSSPFGKNDNPFGGSGSMGGMMSDELDNEAVKKSMAEEFGADSPMVQMGPEILSELGRDPQILDMLANPKIQEMMNSVVNGGEADFMRKISSDPCKL
jgi:hypothetical protein